MGPLKYFFKKMPIVALIVLLILAIAAFKFIGFIFSHIILFAVIGGCIYLFVKYYKKS